MIFPIHFRKQLVFRKVFQIKVTHLIEMHILCCIDFYLKDEKTRMLWVHDSFCPENRICINFYCIIHN